MNDMKKTKEGVNLKKKKFLRLKNTGSILVLMGLLIIFVIGIERSDAVTIPIIALSANAFIDDIQESLDSGMNDHISKPINMEEVTDTIAKYIKDDTCLEKELKQKQNDR